MSNETETRNQVILDAIAALSTEIKSEIKDLKVGQQKLEIKIATVEARIVAFEGKLAGLEGRVNQIDGTLKTTAFAYVSLLAVLIIGLLTITGQVVFFSGKF